MRERTRLDTGITAIEDTERELADNLELLELGEAESDAEVVAEAEAALVELGAGAAKRELETLLSGEADANDCYIEVHAGAGGTEAQDWAEMMLRMYARWAEAHGYKVEWIEESAGEEAGLKSASVRIVGANAYGWLKTESGVHRLVRISPYDSSARRHTSFASIGVYPVVDDTIVVDIQDKDVRVDTYRASGAGGQHVNRTDSAVRMTHLSTGIVVQCQNDRSQHRNRATAMAMLRARLYEFELRKREEAAQAEHVAKIRYSCSTSSATWRDVPCAPVMFTSADGWRNVLEPVVMRYKERKVRLYFRGDAAFASPISAGATRSALTCCSPTRWSRTCAPGSRPRTPRPSSTATSTTSWRPPSPPASREASRRTPTRPRSTASKGLPNSPGGATIMHTSKMRRRGHDSQDQTYRDAEANIANRNPHGRRPLLCPLAAVQASGCR